MLKVAHSMSRNQSLLSEGARIVLPLVIIGIGIAAFLTFGRRSAESRIADEEARIELVETVTVTQHTGGIDLDVDGVAVPSSEIDVVAEVAGRIIFKSPECEAGTFVAQGTLLVKIDPRDYELDVRRLDEEVRQAEVMVEELEIERKNTIELKKLAEEDLVVQRREMARIKKVAQRNVVTQSELDIAQRGVIGSRRRLMELDNQMVMFDTRRTRLERSAELSRAKRDQVQLALDRTEITAPIDGVIITDTVEADSYAQRGAVLFAIEDVSTVEVQTNLRMEELRWVWQQAVSSSASADTDGAINDASRGYKLPPTPVTVLYRLAGNEYSWSGVLSRYDGLGLDERTRTAPCRVVVQRPREVSIAGSGTLLPGAPPALLRGMFVTVRVHTQPIVTLLNVPEPAVRPGNMVWRVGPDNRLEMIEIRPARVTDDGVLFEAAAESLAVGDRVIVSPLAAATDGMLIREQTSP